MRNHNEASVKKCRTTQPYYRKSIWRPTGTRGNRRSDNDAKACYNCVIPLVLALAQIQAGPPVRTAQFFLWALHQLKYHMVTRYGPTKKGITSTKEAPV
eukprot:2345651-Ditylum_brightwellii.AAC.1